MLDLKRDISNLEVGLVNNRRQKLLREYGLITDCARILKIIDKKFLNLHKVPNLI